MAGRRGLMQVWRESLQFRTVVTTVLVTVLVVGTAGIVLMQRISAGILASELRSAQAEAAAGRALARTYAVDEAGSNPNNLIDDLVSELAARLGSTGTSATPMTEPNPVWCWVPRSISREWANIGCTTCST